MESLSLFLFLDFTYSCYSSSIPIPQEQVTKLSIYSTRLSYFSPNQHFFLVCKTTSGKKIRLDHSKDFGFTWSNNYVKGIFDSIYRSGLAIPSMTTSHAMRVFEKHSKLHKPDNPDHNCKNVALNTFEELSGESASSLAHKMNQLKWNVNEKEMKKLDYLERLEKFRIIERDRVKMFDIANAALISGKTKYELEEIIQNKNFIGDIEIKFKFDMLFKTLIQNGWRVSYDLEFMKGFNNPDNSVFHEYKNIYLKLNKGWKKILEFSAD